VTLWTDFALFGPAQRLEAMRRAHSLIPDYHVISADDG
jgi:hypothetical protein